MTSAEGATQQRDAAAMPWAVGGGGDGVVLGSQRRPEEGGGMAGAVPCRRGWKISGRLRVVKGAAGEFDEEDDGGPSGRAGEICTGEEGEVHGGGHHRRGR